MKNIVIIGGSRGIGHECVKDLLKKENQVFLFSRSAPSTDISSNSLLHYEQYDAKDEFNDSSLPDVIDGYVYFPGTINLRPFERIKSEDFQNDLNINLLYNVRILQKMIKRLKASTDSPSAVFFSTVAVEQGMPFHSSIAMAKGAIEGLTKSLAAEYAPKVRFNCISPSLVETPLSEKITGNEKMKESSANRHPLKRIGKAADIASAVNFLLSSDSSWITGQNIHIDGGMSSLKI